MCHMYNLNLNHNSLILFHEKCEDETVFYKTMLTSRMEKNYPTKAGKEIKQKSLRKFFKY